MIPEWLNNVNAIAWVAANLFVAYIAVVLVFFVVAYVIFFDPKKTTGGKLIFRFMLSLVGVVGLVFVGIFVDPSSGREWLNYPGDVATWRPVVRAAIWAYVSFTITALAVLLIVRRFKPHRTPEPEDDTLVKLRGEN